MHIAAFYGLEFKFHNCLIILFVNQLASVFEIIFAFLIHFAYHAVEQSVTFFLAICQLSEIIMCLLGRKWKSEKFNN